MPITALSGKPVASVSCGDTHTLVAMASGELYSFGRNQNGQLGTSNTEDSMVPQLVEALKVCLCKPAASVNGSGWPWEGERGGTTCTCNWKGEPRLNTMCMHAMPFSVQEQMVVSVACGAEHSVCSTAEGKVFAWGWGR